MNLNSSIPVFILRENGIRISMDDRGRVEPWQIAVFESGDHYVNTDKPDRFYGLPYFE